jgi:hypothetical protein
MSKKRKLKVAAFFDGRPGHEKQTRGIIEQLKTKIDVEILPVELSRKPVPVQIIHWLKYLFAVHPPQNNVADCNLLIGTGTSTHLPMLLLKKHHNIPVVTCMTPASFLQKKFDLIFAPQHDNPTPGENIFTTIGPPNLNIDKGRHRDDRVLLLCGGVDPKSHAWNTGKIIKSFETLIVHDDQKRYILSSSPRTPADTIQQMSQLAKVYSHLEFYDYRETPSGWLENEYNRCRRVWVTGDSISMVYEALSAGCLVGVIPVQWRSKRSKFQRSEEYLKKSGLITGLEAYLHGKGTRQNVQPLQEAHRCAEEILRRFL